MRKVLAGLFIAVCSIMTLVSCVINEGYAEIDDVELEEGAVNSIELVSMDSLEYTVTAAENVEIVLPEKVLVTDVKGNRLEISVEEWEYVPFDTTKSGVYEIVPHFKPQYNITDKTVFVCKYTVEPTRNISKIDSVSREVLSYCGQDPALPEITAYDEFSNKITKNFYEWKCEEFHNRKLGEHIFKAELVDGYIYSGEMPEIIVDVIFNTDERAPYVAPYDWYAPRYETGTLTGGDYVLKNGVMGLKVYYVQKALGLWAPIWGYYQSPVINKVIAFQSQNGLSPTGIVDLETWLKLGLNENDWYSLGTYITPVAINENSTRQEIIDIFIDTARSYLGTTYVVGASGKPGEGADCSGLVLQCLYAIGIYPDIIDPVQHSTLEEYNSRLMWEDPKFKQIEKSELLPGDLVFYRGPVWDSVCHVAIYIGDGLCIEAFSGKAEIMSINKDWMGYPIKGYKRVIAK